MTVYKCLDIGGTVHFCKESSINGYLVYKCSCGQDHHLNIEWCFKRQSEYCCKCLKEIPAFKMIQEYDGEIPETTENDLFNRYEALNIIKSD